MNNGEKPGRETIWKIDRSQEKTCWDPTSVVSAVGSANLELNRFRFDR